MCPAAAVACKSTHCKGNCTAVFQQDIYNLMVNHIVVTVINTSAVRTFFKVFYKTFHCFIRCNHINRPVEVAVFGFCNIGIVYIVRAGFKMRAVFVTALCCTFWGKLWFVVFKAAKAAYCLTGVLQSPSSQHFKGEQVTKSTRREAINRDSRWNWERAQSRINSTCKDAYQFEVLDATDEIWCVGPPTLDIHTVFKRKRKF